MNKPLKTIIIGASLTAALIALAALTMGALADDRAEQGRRAYSVYCASCHGQAGGGDGPVAGDLKVAPTDLTRLAARNDGRFPRDRTYQVIDGRLATRGHGTAEMPVWGATFQVSGSDYNEEREVRERLLDLLSYIESIQQRQP